MKFNVRREVNASNDISCVATIHYEEEEREALTLTQSWEKPCLEELSVWNGLFRGVYKVNRPTFRQFVAPGIRLTGFTDQFATYFENGFESKYGSKVAKAFAPILENYRKQIHEERATTRDDYFGVNTNARAIR